MAEHTRPSHALVQQILTEWPVFRHTAFKLLSYPLDILCCEYAASIVYPKSLTMLSSTEDKAREYGKYFHSIHTTHKAYQHFIMASNIFFSVFIITSYITDSDVCTIMMYCNDTNCESIHFPQHQLIYLLRLILSTLYSRP